MSTIIVSLAVLGGVGFLFSVLLAYLSKKLHVEVDTCVKNIIEVLPGLNCGACGLSGCRAYAEAVVREKNIFSGCLPGGDEVNKKISAIIGIQAGITIEKKVVVCHCQASDTHKKRSATYLGPQNCSAAHLTGGVVDCSWGCIGYGDCVSICPTQALSLEQGRIKVEAEKCIGCGKCVQTCPRNLFELIPPVTGERRVYVGCSNKEKMLAVKQVCSRGCLGCGICVKLVPAYFYLETNLSKTRYEKRVEAEAIDQAIKKCPTHCIDTQKYNERNR